MSDKIHRFQLGDLTCMVIVDAQGSGDFSGVFPTVPQETFAEAARAIDYDPAAIPQQVMPLAIKTGQQWVLIDAGNPQGDDAGTGKTLHGLRAAGITPADIEVVIITHCHPDHIGGLTDDAGALIYPNARYVFWQTEWDFWLSEAAIAERGEEYIAFVRAKLMPIQEKTTLISEETAIVPGISAVSLPGHTPGHMGLRLESAGEQLLHIADTAHVLMQMAHPDWSPRFDVDPALSAVTRRKVFQQAAEEKTLVIGFHFPFPGLGHIIPDGNAYQWLPVVS